MKILKTPFVELMLELVLASLLVAGMTATSWAGTPTTRDDSVTVIHLDEYNGYFAAYETFASHKAGEYEFATTNRMEYQYVSRSASESLTLADNDLFVGGRLALNGVQNTALLAGVVFDMDTTETFFNIETKRRFGDGVVLELRVQDITAADSGKPEYAFSRDGYIQWRIVRNF